MGKYLVILITLILVIGGVYMLSSSTTDSMKEMEDAGKGNSGNPDSGKEQAMYKNQPEMTIDTQKTYTAVMTTTKGVMKIVLDPKETPVTVNNFVFLAREGYYDGTIFHRVMENFMIQGGDPTGTGTGSPGYRFNDEPVSKDYTRGTIAMANSGPNKNGSQFFIMHKDYQLAKSYVIFGSIDPGDAESLKTLDAIAAIDVEDNGMGEMSKPVEPVTVEQVVIEEK